jgi:hypothetical protein
MIHQTNGEYTTPKMSGQESGNFAYLSYEPENFRSKDEVHVIVRSGKHEEARRATRALYQ